MMVTGPELPLPICRSVLHAALKVRVCKKRSHVVRGNQQGHRGRKTDNPAFVARGLAQVAVASAVLLGAADGEAVCFISAMASCTASTFSATFLAISA